MRVRTKGGKCAEQKLNAISYIRSFYLQGNSTKILSIYKIRDIYERKKNSIPNNVSGMRHQKLRTSKNQNK